MDALVIIPKSSYLSKEEKYSWQETSSFMGETCLHLYTDGCFRFNIQKYSEMRYLHLIYHGMSHIQIILRYHFTFKKIPLIYLELVLLSSGLSVFERIRLEEGILGLDSTGVETDRYDYEVRPVKSKRKFEKILVKQYLKWHVTATLDHLIILRTGLTSKTTHDSPVLRTMLNRLRNRELTLLVQYSTLIKGTMEKGTLNHYLVYPYFQISNRDQTPRKVKTGRR